MLFIYKPPLCDGVIPAVLGWYFFVLILNVRLNSSTVLIKEIVMDFILQVVQGFLKSDFVYQVIQVWNNWASGFSGQH